MLWWMYRLFLDIVHGVVGSIERCGGFRHLSSASREMPISRCTGINSVVSLVEKLCSFHIFEYDISVLDNLYRRSED